jgi:hypothetical protein
LDSARQVRHRRLQPRPDPCQDRYCSHDWPERTNLVLSPRSSQSERCQTSPGNRAKWPLPDARSGVDNLTMMCIAEPHMWRLTKHKPTGYCRSPAGISALLGIVAFWRRRGRGGVGVRERLEGPCQLGSIRSEIGLRTVVDPNAELVPSEYVCWISNRHALASCTPVPYRLRMSRYRVGIWRRWGMGESKTTNEADMEAKGKRDLPNTEYGRRRNERGT